MYQVPLGYSSRQALRFAFRFCLPNVSQTEAPRGGWGWGTPTSGLTVTPRGRG